MRFRILLAFLSLVGLAVLAGCDSSKPKTPSGQSVERLTIGIRDPKDSLIWVAEDQGYFSENGLKISTKFYQSGLAATKDLLAGKLDLATAAEFVAARHILERTDLRIITNICEADDVKLVARRDHGITQLSDIKHKRIGLVRGTVAEFYLELLMTLGNIPFQEVQIADMSSSEQVEAILKGEVDAVITWSPFVSEISNNLRTNALSWSAQSGQNYYWLLLGTTDVISKRSRAINAFVSSLVSAEEFIKNHRDEAKKIVAKKWGTSHFETPWEEIIFKVGLDNSLVLAMQAQMRWMNPEPQVRQTNIPDLLSFIYFDALNSVQPGRIKILR